MEPHLVFHFANDSSPGGLSFSDPIETITTTSLNEVRSCLREVQCGVDRGLYAAGFLSYEAAPALDPSLKVRAPTELPLIWFGLFRGPTEPALPQPGTFQLSPWEPSVTRALYDSHLALVREAIACGDTYQVNYTFRLRADFAGDDYAFYRRLAAAQGASYSAYLNLGRYRILSISPELFFDLDGTSITTRPMKGTMKRGHWQEEDMLLGARLHGSEKNRAENVMIVDLVRNDLGRIAETGSVQVTKLFAIERYSILWQMTSTIEATLPDSCSLEDIFAALFPSGSITGAPKISTMKLITELEDSPRSAYCGAVGFLTPHREATFNVAIRTVVIDSELGRAEYGVGGGITWDSTTADEYEEALNKAVVLLESGGEFQLLETMRLEHGHFELLERHLERLYSSALYFDFNLSLERIMDRLLSFAERSAAGILRVRLLVSRTGDLKLESEPLVALPAQPVLVAVASQSVSRNDLFLYHKTTERTVFERLRSEFPEAYDVLLWNEEGEVTEFSSGNLVAKLDGEMITPPREAGLLAGTLRAQLIEEGVIRERVLKLSELGAATELWLINSVRGWVPVCLDGMSQ